MKKATNDGKRGGTLEGKPHYDKQGNDAGGIKAVVTDAGNKPVELEGGEVIINKEASKKHWKLLSKINQSAGNGVPIHKPTDPHDEDPLEEYKGGGNIDFNVNHVPNKWILNYAKKIKEKHPEVWKLGGNIFGNEAYKNLSRVSERGYWLDSEEWMYKKWQSFLARHQHDFRIAGVIAMLKWAGKVNKGWAYMKDLIEAEIQKREGKKKKTKFDNGGSIEEDCIEFIKKSASIKTNGHYLHIKNLNILVGEDDNVVPNVKSLLLITYNSGGQSNLKASETINASALSTEISKLIGGNINVARIIVSEQIRHAKRFSVSVLKGLENENIIVADRDRIVCTNLMPNYEDGGSVGFENELFDELAEHDAPSFKKGGNVVTYKQKFNRKYGFDKDESHSLAEISKLTKIKLSAIQDIYDKGIGAYKTNPQSVRPNVKSKEQWAMARVYSAVMGGKAARVDANELERGRKYHLGGDMTKHLAPNGKPSNLTHEQWHLVRTPEFKAWFGDWEKLAMAKLKDAAMDEVTLANLSKDVSKVIDENGEPLVVYHGSESDHTTFDENKIGLTDRGWYGYGYYFSPTTQMSDYYGKSKPYFIKIKNPFNTNKENPLYLGGKDVTQDYISKGYDGASKTLDVNKLYHEYCVFFPFSKNIKLADGSNTTFDGSNPDIRYATGGNVFDKYLKSGSILDDEEILSKYDLKRFTLQNKYNIAHLDTIISNEKNSGAGTRAMNDLIEWADSNGITMALTPSTSYGATSVSRLKDYYKRFGFVDNKGSNKVWSTTASMIRKPKLGKFSNGGGISDYSKVESASSRFKPSETIVFNPPLVGTNGAKLTAYTWAYEKVMLPNYEGELVGRRVSDWTQAETSAETGRDIVHKYTIELPNGETRVVSSESVPMLLGYVDRSQAKVFGNLATASKTLAKQQMKLATLEAQQKEYNDAIKSITDKGYPKEIVVESDGFRKYQLMVGDGSCVINDDGSYDNERLQCARDSYVANRLNEMGFDRYKSNKSWAISDLKPRIERQKRKVEQMLNTTIMEKGGELAKGIKTEMEHSATIDKFKRSNVSTEQVATAIAKDHLGENKNYYSRLSEVEKKMKTGGNTFSPQMDTPDGEKTRLTYFQQNIVRTQTFKEFFGDWETAAKNFIGDGYRNFDVHYANVSKVIDLQTLEPIVLFHGTNSDKEFFDFDVATEKQMGRPYAYFAYEEKYSENFMQFSQRNQHGIPLKYKAFINVRRPFYALGSKFELQRGNEDYWFKVITDRMIFDILGTNPDPQKVNDYKNVFRTQIYSFLEGVFINNNLPFWTAMARDNKSVFKRFLMTYKYDGIIYHEEISSVFEKSDPSQYTKAVTVFNANDIKLADGRNLTFDPMKSDVRYEDGGNIDITNVEVKQATKVDELGKQLFGNQYVEKFGMFGSEKMEISQSAEQNHNNLFVQNLINKLKK